MKKIIKNTLTLIAALIGFIGGFVWAFKSSWEAEPIILIGISAVEIVSFLLIDKEPISNTSNEKEKALTRILFIDDKHTEFRIISILKKAGWINTKSVRDIADLDDPMVTEASIIFVDINGVGIPMFQDQGLGLASALKKRHPSKTIVLYSSEPHGDRFHKALREVDSCLPKNAEPYQFISLIESIK